MSPRRGIVLGLPLPRFISSFALLTEIISLLYFVFLDQTRRPICGSLYKNELLLNLRTLIFFIIHMYITNTRLVLFFRLTWQKWIKRTDTMALDLFFCPIVDVYFRCPTLTEFVNFNSNSRLYNREFPQKYYHMPLRTSKILKIHLSFTKQQSPKWYFILTYDVKD